MGQTMSGGSLVALVVTFNRLDQLKRTLGQLLDSPPAVLSAVVVVDNATTDGTAEWLAAQTDPRLTVLTQTENLGGAGGFEVGMRHVAEVMDPDWIVLMDDDGRPEPGVLERFQAECRSEAEAWLAAVYHPDGRICDINRPWVNPFWHRDVFWRTLTGKGRDGFHMSASDYDAPAPVEIDGGSFVGLFVSREGMKKAGYPDGRLFVYGEDVLFTLA